MIFSRIRSWLEWRRKDREEIAVATASFETWYRAHGVDTGEVSRHVVIFYRDGNGVRYSRVDTSDDYGAGRNSGLLEARTLWRVHGYLPDHAIKCSIGGAT